MQTVLWACPNGCEVDTVLVCGGDLGVEGKPNIYFQMHVDGTYTNRFSDGSLGVPGACHDHADAGCYMEPQCPECLCYCEQQKINQKQRFTFSAKVITSGGLLVATACSAADDSVNATLSDELGEWKKEFLDSAEFRKWFRGLHIKNIVSMAENYA